MNIYQYILILKQYKYKYATVILTEYINITIYKIVLKKK